MGLNSAHVFIICMMVLFSFQLYRCIHKYHEFETIDKRQIIEMDNNHFPMVSITPTPGYKITKPGSFFNIAGSIRDYCFLEDMDENTNYTACVDSLAFEPYEIVDTVLYNDAPLAFENVVVKPYSPLLVTTGRTFTFSYQGLISGEGQRFTFKIRNMANFSVHPSLSFQFHAEGTYFPYVYLDAQNFDKRAEKIFTASTNNHGVASVLLKKHYRMNTPKSPCIEEDSYTVLKCVERFFTETIGCVSPWTNIKSTYKTCDTESELDALVQLQARIFQISSSDFASLTGCHQPCVKHEVEVIKYTELKFPYFQDGSNSFIVILVSTSMIEIRETLLYDLNSMVGEIGGSLGLFLGMSLVQIYKEGLRIGRKMLMIQKERKLKTREHECEKM